MIHHHERRKVTGKSRIRLLEGRAFLPKGKRQLPPLVLVQVPTMPEDPVGALRPAAPLGDRNVLPLEDTVHLRPALAPANLQADMVCIPVPLRQAQREDPKVLPWQDTVHLLRALALAAANLQADMSRIPLDPTATQGEQVHRAELTQEALRRIRPVPTPTITVGTVLVDRKRAPLLSLLWISKRQCLLRCL
jgi:hypothetical protein